MEHALYDVRMEFVDPTKNDFVSFDIKRSICCNGIYG